LPVPNEEQLDSAIVNNAMILFIVVNDTSLPQVFQPLIVLK
jgi:hypothetical protein